MKKRLLSLIMAICMMACTCQLVMTSSAADIYYVSATGSDTATGTQASPLATVKKAMQLIGAQNNGTIRIIGSFVMKSNDYISHTGTITIEGADSNAVLCSDNGTYLTFGGPCVLQNLSYKRGTNSYVMTSGHELTIGENFKPHTASDWWTMGAGYGATAADRIKMTVNSGSFLGTFNIGGIMPSSAGATINNDARLDVLGGSIPTITLGSSSWGACGAVTFAKNVVVVNDGGSISGIKAVATGNGSPTKINGALIVVSNNGLAMPSIDSTINSIAIGSKYYVSAGVGGRVSPMLDESNNARAGKFMIEFSPDTKSAEIINGGKTTTISQSGEITLNEGITSITFSENQSKLPPNPGTTNPMTWKPLDKGYITFCFDDNRADLENYVEIVMRKYNLPLCAAVPSNAMNNNIVLLREIENRGGEILSHTKTHMVIKPFVTPWSDVEVELGDSYNTLTNAGFNINGIILAGGQGQIQHSDTEYRGLIELVTNKYYKYSDKYGLSTQYWKQRNWFSGRSIDELKAIVDKQIADKSWEVIYGHGLSECSEETITELVEYIIEKKNQGLVDLVTYKYMHENFGDFENPVDFGDTKYTVDFYGNDGKTFLGSAVTVEGGSVSAPTDLYVAPGYTLSGWSGSLENITNNKKLTAVCVDAGGISPSPTQNVVTPPRAPTKVYVNATTGDDANDGKTPQTAIKTIQQSLNLVDKALDFEVVIIGSVPLPITVGGHSAMMTISGYDEEAVLTTQNNNGHFSGGDITLKNIGFNNGLYAWYVANGYKFIVGEGVNTSFGKAMQLNAGGCYASPKLPKMELEFNSGNFNRAGLSVMASSTNHQITGDAKAVIKGGTINQFRLGGDGWGSTQKSADFKRNVLLRMDGGAISSILVTTDNYAPTFEGAIELIFNNGKKANSIPSFENITVPKGVYTIYSEQGGFVDFNYDEDNNSIAGSFVITPDEGKYAIVKTGSEQQLVYAPSVVTLKKGVTNVTYKNISELEGIIKVTTASGENNYFPQDIVQITTGGVIALPNGLEKAGHIFGGWFKDSSFSIPVANGSSIEPCTIYARWIPFSANDLKIEGVQIRINDKPGIRFISNISHSLRSAIIAVNPLNNAIDPENEQFNLSEEISYGSVVLPKEYLGDNELAKNQMIPKSPTGYYVSKTVPARKTFSINSDHDSYTVVITKLPDKLLTRSYAVRPYISYADASGAYHTIYGNTQSISTYEVAKSLYESGLPEVAQSERQAQLDFLHNNILTKADGVMNSLANTYRAIHNDKKLTVGFLGGSITYGNSALRTVNSDGTVSTTGGNIANSYVNRTIDWLKATFPETQIEAINAGISDTATNLGVYRLEKHLMNTDGHDLPDLLFIEFTSNDWIYSSMIEQTHQDVSRQIESLVKLIYSKNPYTDIVFVFSARSETSSSRMDYVNIAEHYGIPYIDMGIPMQALMNQRGASQEASGTYYYTVDNLHPSNHGYEVYFEQIKNALEPELLNNTVYYAAKKDHTQGIPEQLNRSLWENPRIIPAESFSFTGQKTNAGAVYGSMFGSSQTTSGQGVLTDSSIRITSPDTTASFSFDGTSFGLIFNMNSSGFNIDYQIDGHGWKNAKIDDDILTFQKYNHAQIFIFEQELAYGNHTIELKFNNTTDGKVDVVIAGAAVSGADNGLDKLIAMSIDDGPNQSSTGHLVDALKRNNATATFFFVGQMINSSTTPLLKKVIEAGCEIGNHGNGYSAMTSMTEQELLTDFNTVQSKVYNATGKYPKLFRAPGLAVNELMHNTIPLPKMSGRLGIADWEPESSVGLEARIDAIMNNVKDGAILLMHDLEVNARAFDATLPRINEMGFKVVSISELIKLRGYAVNADSKTQYSIFAK